jgi:hypothetical protein
VSGLRGDETVRGLRREIAAGAGSQTWLRLAHELERRSGADDALLVLFDALKQFPKDPDVTLAIGKFRGPAPGPWGAPCADGKNTRLSPAKGPRGLEGKVLQRTLVAPTAAAGFTLAQNERTTIPPRLKAPLVVGARVYTFLEARRFLAVTADGHAVTQNFGATGHEWSLERDGKRPWSHFFPHETDDMDAWSEPHAAIGPDATIYGVTSPRKLIAFEPDGTRRYTLDLPAKVTSLALDAERGKLHLAYDQPAALSTRDLATGVETGFLELGQLVAVSEAIVCPDGRVVCLSPFGLIGIVNLEGKLEHETRCAERISGAFGALSPWGELVVVSFDPKGALVSLFDPATGGRRGSFEAPECAGIPAIDAEGTIYLDGGARGHAFGFDLVSGTVRYKLDRDTLWRSPEQGLFTTFSLAEGELLFVQLEKGGVTLLRAGA